MNPSPRTISVFKTAFAWYLKSMKRGVQVPVKLATESVTLNCLSNPWSVALQCVCCCCAVHNVKFDILLASPLCFVFVSALGCSNARLMILLGISLGKYDFMLYNIDRERKTGGESYVMCAMSCLFFMTNLRMYSDKFCSVKGASQVNV